MTEPALRLEGLTRRFGGVTAVDNVSVSIPKGEIVGLVGPNGAGKTTLVNLVTGFVPKTAGQVFFEGTDVTRLPPHQIARNGIARTFQIVQPFAEMTVLENVMAGALFAGQRGTMKEADDKARHFLEFVGLDRFADYSASELSLADRKRLELAKSLAMEPRLLFLDEVNAGLNSGEIDNALELIRKVSRMGVTIIIIEHVLRIVLSLVKRLIVLHHGAMLSDGPPAEVLKDAAVIKAYLGTKFGKRHEAEFHQQQEKYQQELRSDRGTNE
ncbi:MAG: ABC transporter ATP-binding protein [Xanthobacteraceae bacterium]|jgi:branched-chain amino acid transport system ATP-binding protein|nr:ABC transporter ATP-binding protein [Xanthobacteraceae bacterium]